MVGKVEDDHRNRRYKDVCSVQQDSPSSVKVRSLVVTGVHEHEETKRKKRKVSIDSDLACDKSSS